MTLDNFNKALDSVGGSEIREAKEIAESYGYVPYNISGYPFQKNLLVFCRAKDEVHGDRDIVLVHHGDDIVVLDQRLMVRPNPYLIASMQAQMQAHIGLGVWPQDHHL